MEGGLDYGAQGLESNKHFLTSNYVPGIDTISFTIDTIGNEQYCLYSIR